MPWPSVSFIACLLGLVHFKKTYSLPLADKAVRTTNGLIIGHEAPNRSDVIEFLGIPYAQPPLDQLRFASPVKYGKSNGIYNASKWVIQTKMVRCSSLISSTHRDCILTMP